MHKLCKADGPSISVLLPVYNSKEYVSSSVESILAQTFKDFELIVVDDGSTDGSLGILEAFAEKDKRIRLISRENTGYVVALNEMLALARGEFVARMDSDDIAMPERLHVQHEFFKAHPDVACVGTFVDFIDAKGRFLRVEGTACEDGDIQRRLLCGECPICHPSVMMRTSAVRAVGGYRADFQPAEDRDLWLRLGERFELCNIPKRLLRYRLHSGSVSERKQELQILNMRRACEEAWQRRGVEGSFSAKMHFRPSAGRDSRFRCHLRYGWWAFQSGERRTAASYGAAAVRLMPWRPEGWKLLAVCGVKRCGPKPEQTDVAANDSVVIHSGDER